MRPIIGITPQVTDDEKRITLSLEYISLINDLGGVANVLTYGALDKIVYQLERIDGLLLTGGGDIDPYFFGELPIKESGSVTPLRDEYEIVLCQQAIKRDIPVFGICRGVQVLAVATGGKIAQDIYTTYRNNFIIKHSQDAPRYYPTHEVLLLEGSMLHKITNTSKIRVNSFHHQAVSSVGDDMQICAAAPDGIIEAIELINKRFVLGVQWHPESMYKYDNNQTKITKAFISAST